MKDYALFIKETLDRYKGKYKHEPLKHLPVYNDQTILCAYLRPITEDYRITLPGCSDLLGKWREDNPGIATGTFQVTRERTEKWLDAHIIGRDDRILFLITALDGQFLGHIGFSSFNYQEKSCEVDAVLRGVKDVHPGLMGYALNSLIFWGLHDLQLEKITLMVFADNTHAIQFYKRCGFQFVQLIPLGKVVLPSEEKWEISPQLQGTVAERYYTEMIYKGIEVL